MPHRPFVQVWILEQVIQRNAFPAFAAGGELPDPGDGDEGRSPRDAASLADRLEQVVVPLF